MADRIGFTTDDDSIIELWAEVFGDSEDDIRFFLQNCKNKSCLGYYKDGHLVSMLFLIDCEYCGKNGAYIYAVCTKKAFRNAGFSSALIEKAKSQNYDFLWLIPANDSLFGFYERFGFKTKLYSDGQYKNNVTFSESADICSYLYEGSDYKFPKGMIYSDTDLPQGGTGFKIKE